MIDSKLFNARPGHSVLILPNHPTYTVIAVSDDFVRNTGVRREAILTKGIFELFPQNPTDTDFNGEQNLSASFERIIKEKKPHELPLQRYDIPNGDGTFSNKYWKALNVPVIGDDGEVCYLIHNAEDVTSQVEALQRKDQLKDIEKAFDLFMQAPVAVCIVRGSEHIVELANEQMLQLLGRTTAMIGKRIDESLPEANLQGLLAVLEKVRITGESLHLPSFPAALLINGVREQRYFDLVFQPYFKQTTDAVPGGIFCVAYNVTKQITAQKQLEELQKETEKQRRLYETINGSTPDLIYVFDLEYRFTYANTALLTMWGSTWDQSIGKSLLENGYEPWHAEMHEREIDQVVATGQAVRGEVSFPHATLGKRLYDYIFVPVFNHKGEVEAVAGTTRDITEIKMASQTIRESEERFRHLADDSPMFVFIIDADPMATVSYWNKIWLQYTGQTLEEAIGRSWDGIIHPDDVPVVMSYYASAFQTKQPYFIPSVRVKRHDGLYRWHAFKGNPRYLPTGDFNGYVGVGFDVHEQKVTEEGLEALVDERTRELQRSNEDLQQFAHVASHDLKEPVRKIRTFGSILSEEFATALPTKAKIYLGKMESAAERMATMIEGVLRYSSIDASDKTVEEIDLNEIITTIEEDFEILISEKNAVIKHTPIPRLEGSFILIYQLFYNLIYNSLKFSKAAVAPVIEILCESPTTDVLAALGIEGKAQNYIILTIKDNGIGFNPDQGAKIFKTFSRLHSKDKYDGTGLGLALCKKIVERHGGVITGKGVEGEGAMFEIILPLKQESRYI